MTCTRAERGFEDCLRAQPTGRSRRSWAVTPFTVRGRPRERWSAMPRLQPRSTPMAARPGNARPGKAAFSGAARAAGEPCSRRTPGKMQKCVITSSGNTTSPIMAKGVEMNRSAFRGGVQAICRTESKARQLERLLGGLATSCPPGQNPPTPPHRDARRSRRERRRGNAQSGALA